ncbi:O-antigen ligase family protein [Paraliobacillus sediminis]|uniref:O-antigen ligase family protein n=1 Tax=Paraliobacillus sediminis TaxID=1885916 RepID=UPI000E3BC2CB|nr:O-antigen ligase family protein [Paraliobacillus sediminis]
MNNSDNGSLKFSRFTYILICSLLIVNTLALTSHEALHQVGTLSIMASLLFFLCLFIYYILHNYHNIDKLFHLYLYSAMYFIIYIITFFISAENNSFSYLFALLSTLSFILISSHNQWQHKYLKLFAHITSGIIWLVFLNWLLIELIFDGYQSISKNPNSLAIVLFCILYMQLLTFRYSSYIGRSYFGLLICINLFLIYTTSARSVFLSILIILLSMLILLYSKKVFSKIFSIGLILNFGFILIYVQLENTKIGQFLNEVSLNLLDKSFYSGRNEIWKQLLPYVYDKPFFGYGIGIDARGLTSPAHTSHNQYIQILLESGVIGLILFLLLLFSIWKLLLRNLTTFESKLSACFFIATLVYMNFESTLFQNNYAIGLMQWLIITLGVIINPVEDSTRVKGVQKE